MNLALSTRFSIGALLLGNLLWNPKVAASIDYTSGLYWGSGLTRIVLKGVPGNPDFLVPIVSANIEASDRLMYQFRLAYGGSGSTTANLDRSVGLYAKYHLWRDGFIRPYALLGYTTTKYTNNTLFSQSSETSSGLSAGIGLKFVNSEALQYAVEVIGLNRENDHVNAALSVKVYYRF